MVSIRVVIVKLINIMSILSTGEGGGKLVTKIILYIGAENKTKKITKEYEREIERILQKYWTGFIRHKGYYEGDIEDLKVKLVQKTIGCEVIADVDFKLR